MTTYIEDVQTNPKFQGNVVVLLNGSYYSSFQPDSGLTVDSDKLGVVVTLRQGKSKVDLKRINQAIPKTTFVLLDKDNIITALFKDDETALVNTPIEIYLGRVGQSMDFADYYQLPNMEISKIEHVKNEYVFTCKNIIFDMQRPIFTQRSELAVDILAATTTITLVSASGFPTSGTGRINSSPPEFISWTGISGNNLTGVVRAEEGSTAADHNKGLDFDQVTTITGNPIDLLLQVLISGGGGGPYDVLSDGLGFDPARIDVTGIETIRDELFIGETFEYKMFNIPNALKFIEKELLLGSNARFRDTSDNTLGLAILDQATFEDSTSSIDDTSIESQPRWKVDINTVTNQIEMRWDWDDVKELYQQSTIFNDTDSITNFGETRTLILSFKGILDANSGAGIIQDRGDRLLQRFKDSTPEIKIRTHIDKSLLNIGDKVSLINKQTPSANGTLDFEDTLEVVDRTINHRLGLSAFTLKYTSYSGIRAAFIAPTGGIDSVTDNRTVTLDSGLGVQWESGYKVLLYNCVTGLYESDPVNTIAQINGDQIVFAQDWVTTPVGGVHAIRFAEYPDTTAREKRFGFTGETGGGDFSDNKSIYRITL